MNESVELGRRLGVAVREQLEPLRERIDELEKRAADAMAFKGGYQAAQRYMRGDVVIVDGQIWYALRDHDAGEEKPGSPGTGGWAMIGRMR